MKKTEKRIHGLDVLRSVAIILVFMYHYVVFVSRQPTFDFIDEIGWVGVDLFFVLSGYLIGHQIFSPIVNQREFSFKIFYYRRLLRTLPTYLFVLSVYFLIPSFRENAICCWLVALHLHRKPFLKLRDKIGKVNLNPQIINVNSVVRTIN